MGDCRNGIGGLTESGALDLEYWPIEVKGKVKGPSVENGSNRQQSDGTEMTLKCRYFNHPQTVAATSSKTGRCNC
jgi:hypothetical protein